MDKPKALYLVRNSSGSTLHVWATSSDQAKRRFCWEYGIRTGDYWCGLSTLTARKLKPEEVREWEAQAEADRDTLIFINGMLEIGAKVYAERNGKWIANYPRKILGWKTPKIVFDEYLSTL